MRDASSIKLSASTLIGDSMGLDMPYDSLLNYGQYLNMPRDIMRMSSNGKNVLRIAEMGPDLRGVGWLPGGDGVVARMSDRRELRVRVEALHQMAPDFVREEPLVQFISEVRPALPPSVNYTLLEIAPLADNYQPIFFAYLHATHSDTQKYWLPLQTEPWIADRSASTRIVSLDGSISQLPAEAFDIAWSRDGKRVAYSSFSGEDGSILYIADSSGSTISNRHAVTEATLNAHGPAWSPDGSRIAFSRMAQGGSQIFVIGADGTGQEQLSKNDNVSCSHPAWSPDGKWIVAECQPHQVNLDPVNNAVEWLSNIYLFDAENSAARPRQLTKCIPGDSPHSPSCGAHNPSFAPAEIMQP